jgi:cytochrome c oxidase assembly protein subunit 15
VKQVIHRIKSFGISPQTYVKVTTVALIALVLIVFTGSAVRLTASGLGCPDWPKCYGEYIPPSQINAWIEYGNRLLTGFVGLAVIAASLLAFLRKPFRWHLAVFGALLPLGVIGQIILGAFVVEYHLPPELVIGHFLLSMILLDAAFALFWCSRFEPGERAFSPDPFGVWSVRALIPFGQLTVLLGTITTASGPHPGDHDKELVQRFDFKGEDTLAWIAQKHATAAFLFLFATIVVMLILMRPAGDRRALKSVGVVAGMIVLQIGLGIGQWLLHLPAIMVWFHVALATLIWIAVLWSVGTAGQIDWTKGRRSATESAPLS